MVLSGLAVIVAAGDVIRLYRQRAGALVWLGLLVVPPAVIVAATVTLPWTAAVDLEVSKPANAMGQFFTDTFRRRTGKPLAIVVGDARTAGLVALASPDRPSLYLDASPARAPWLDDEAVRQKGAIVLWTAIDTAGTPPPALKERFPDLVPEVPRSFDRSVQGRLPLLAHRLGDDKAAVDGRCIPASGVTPSPACGGGLGWGHTRAVVRVNPLPLAALATSPERAFTPVFDGLCGGGTAALLCARHLQLQ